MRQIDIIQALKQNEIERLEAIQAGNLTRLIELQSVKIMLLELMLKLQTKAA